MSITARMKVAELLELHPESQEVFDEYGIELDDESMQLTLMALCKEEAINYWELKSDIALAEGWDGAAPGFSEDEDGGSDDDEDEDWEDEDGDDDDGSGVDDEDWDEEEEEEDDADGDDGDGGDGDWDD